jgi:hypothetical protein
MKMKKRFLVSCTMAVIGFAANQTMAFGQEAREVVGHA